MSGDSSFSGQFADLLLGGVDQAYVAPRAQKVIQLITPRLAVLSGCDDGVSWWGNIYANVSEDGSSMVVDFSPKGGPSDVLAYLTPSGHITWTGDNAWERTSYESSFEGRYDSVFQGDTAPMFPDAFESISITATTPGPPDATVGAAAITAAGSAWGDTVVPATIHYNQLTADFSEVGGAAGVVANLTQSGDILWLDSENIWERSLCSGVPSSSSDSSGSDNEDISMGSGAFAGLLVAVSVCSIVIGAIGLKIFMTTRKAKNGSLQDPLMDNSKQTGQTI